MGLAKIRDIFAFFSFVVMFSAMTVEQVTSGDSQWEKGIAHLAPMYYLAVFTLCGAFFIRSNYFKIISAVGPKYSTLDKSNQVKKRVRIRIIVSCVFVVLTLFIFSEGLNHFQDSYESIEYAENDDGTINYSSLESESDIVTECKYNEECVAANILDDSFLFSILAPDSMEFDEGDPTEYNETLGLFTPLYLIMIFWYCMMIFCGIYDFLLKKKPNSQSYDFEWREYYNKKSYHSYGAFLLCVSSLFPSIFLFSNQSQNLTFSGGIILVCASIMVYYIGLYFYSYNHNDFFDPKVGEEFAIIPGLLMAIALIVAFLYAVIASPLENVSDIWLYDWIVGLDEGITFYSDSENYRYRLLDLLLTGLTFGIIALLIAWYQEENYVEEGWYAIPVLLGLASGAYIILCTWGFVAMIGIEIISLNLVWISPFILAIGLGLACLLLVSNGELYLKHLNLPIPVTNSGNNLVKQNLKQQQMNIQPNQLKHNQVAAVSLQDQGKWLRPTINQKENWMIEHLVDVDGVHWAEDRSNKWWFREPGESEWTEWSDGEVLPAIPKSAQQTPPVVDVTVPLNSLPVVTEKPRTVTVDSKGITTIETGFSKVTLNKLTTEVTKIPQGVEQHPMFIQEIQSMVHLEAKGYDVGLIDYDDGASPKIVTRYMGPSKLSEHYKTLSVRGKKNMIEELVEHIAHIHKCGMVHRDLKPDNILVDARPRDGNHQFDAIIDYGIAMKINRRQSESYNTAGTKFFGHSSQKDPDFKASTGQDWFSLARIFALILRGVDIDSLDAEIQMSQTGLEMSSTISTLGFDESIVQSISELIVLATDPNCEDNATIGKLAKVGKALSKKL